LHEVKNCRQIRGELRRRWFSADELDLIVWCNDTLAPVGFQFCYQDGWTERALTWRPRLGYTHATIDDGESNPGLRPKCTPVLQPDGPINFQRLQELFVEACSGLPADIIAFVSSRLAAPAQLPSI
jgi:hypothetical protein